MSRVAASLLLALGSMLTPVDVDAAVVPVTCGTVIRSGDVGELNGETISCDCGNVSPSYCVRVNEGASLTGSGVLRCPPGSATCTEAAVKVEAGASMVAAEIEGIRIQGNDVRLGPSDNGPLSNFKTGIVVTNGHEAHIEKILVLGVGWYGIEIRNSSDVTIFHTRVRGDSQERSINEGIHVANSQVHLEDVVMHYISAEGLYVLSKSGPAFVSVAGLVLKGFGVRDSDGSTGKISGVKVETEGLGSGAALTATALRVESGGTNSRCVTATSRDSFAAGARTVVTIDNEELEPNVDGAGFKGCPVWLEAIDDGSSVDLFASVGGICCSDVVESQGGTVNLTLGGSPAECSGCTCG